MARRWTARSTTVCVLIWLAGAGMGLAPFLHTCVPSVGSDHGPVSAHDEPYAEAAHSTGSGCLACILAGQVRIELTAVAIAASPSDLVRAIEPEPDPDPGERFDRGLHARPPPRCA